MNSCVTLVKIPNTLYRDYKIWTQRNKKICNKEQQQASTYRRIAQVRTIYFTYYFDFAFGLVWRDSTISPITLISWINVNWDNVENHKWRERISNHCESSFNCSEDIFNSVNHTHREGRASLQPSDARMHHSPSSCPSHHRPGPL